MNIATVFESSDPVSMIRRQRGMISVERGIDDVGVFVLLDDRSANRHENEEQDGFERDDDCAIPRNVRPPAEHDCSAARIGQCARRNVRWKGSDAIPARGRWEIGKGKQSTKAHLTSAPITPNDVKRRYSNGRVFDVVLRKGY